VKIQEQNIYHGSALMQIVEHPSFKALNKADGQYGHYQVNTKVRLWVKYSSAEQGPWVFTFHATELAGFRNDQATEFRVFIALICGHHTICGLSEEEIDALVDVKSTNRQWIKVDAPDGKQMRVTGSTMQKNPILVAHNRFPNFLF
jgi:hypothetical protein